MSTAENREHRVARLSDLDPAPSMRPYEVGETKILLVRENATVHGLRAVSGLCPHAGAPLHEGVLSCGTLVCPWHQSRFSVSDGRVHVPPALDGLRSYPVRLGEDGDVFVTLPEAGSPPALALADDEASGTFPGVAEPQRKTVLVMGAGAAGQVAVETLRKVGFGGRVILVGPEAEPPYDRTNLTKHFLSGQAKREDLPLRRDPEFFKNIDVERRITAVERLDVPEKTAVFSDGETLAYDAAILATGGTPKTLDVPGANLPRVCVLRTVADAERLIASLPEKGGRVVAVGASFIGLEAASSLAQRGVGVTVLSPEEIPLVRQLGPEIGASIRRLHERHGVCFLPGVKVSKFEEPAEGGLTVHLENGSELSADAAIVGVGVRPATGFVRGIQLAADGGILVNTCLHAGHDLYAAGDVADFPLPDNAGAGGRARIEHWHVAQHHAMFASRNAVCQKSQRQRLERHSGFVPFFWTFHFGQRMNYVGYAREWDEIIFDGDPNEPPFVAYYVYQGRAIAAAGTHRDADLAAMHELLRMHHPVTPCTPTVELLRAGGYSPRAALEALLAKTHAFNA